MLKIPCMPIQVVQFMQTVSLSERQNKQLCDEVGNLLIAELDTPAVRNRVERTVSNYLKNNNINLNAGDMTKKLSWSVKVALKK